jgi:hypothetical protein
MKNLIYTIMLLMSLSVPIFSQPTVEGQFFEVTNNGTQYVIKVQISTSTGTDILGDATIPFTFNSANLAYASTSFNNFSGVDYSLATATISSNRISLNIVLNNASGGTVVSSAPMDVATITFSTVNSAGSSNLTFDPPLEFFGPTAVQWTVGTFTDLDTNPLPVELSSFTASSNQNGVNLKWQTATEVNNYGFEIERKVHTSSLDFARDDNELSVTEWEKVGFVNGNGNSNSPKTYSFSDNNPSGGSKFYYRLKQIDNDGQFEYSDAVEVEIVPKEFALYQNYPNPFNPNTKINYSVPFDSKVIISIYSITGELVTELVNDNVETGTYSVDFNGSNLASGMYIYKMAAGSFVKTYKMMLMK